MNATQTRAAASPAGRLALGRLHLDTDTYRAALDGRPVPLTRAQIELLALLLANRHRVISRSELSEALGYAGGRSVDVLLSSLRRILGDGFVRNVRGRGWIVEPKTLER